MNFLHRQRKATKVRLNVADEALSEAQANLKRVKSRDEEVSRVAGAMRETLRRNHFSEQLQTLMIRSR